MCVGGSRLLFFQLSKPKVLDTLADCTLLPLPPQPVALVGTAEKGIETWEVVVAGEGGHSSMPPVDGSSGPTH
jgi:acetylornithine deacetylase/succinyl-diaminopimelate desuccinylase-like protein